MNWLQFLFGNEHVTEISANDNGDDSIVISDSGEDNYTEEPAVVDGTGENAEPPKEYKYIILLDNGHASSTPGKRSPKEEGMKQFFEYEFNRDIVRRLSERLSEAGVKYEVLVPEEDEDIALSVRAARANAFCDKYGKDRCIFISIHANAAGNGTKWMPAKGWACYTSKGETASDAYAELFMREADKVLSPIGFNIRKWSANKFSWEENYTVLVKTKCPAILTENLFYDNRNEVQFLQSEFGREVITQIHFNAIMKIENGEGA